MGDCLIRLENFRLRLRIKAGALLPPHKVNVPVTVLTISGQGLLSGSASTADLKAGTLSYLDPGEMHWIEARTDLVLLVTKFSGS